MAAYNIGEFITEDDLRLSLPRMYINNAIMCPKRRLNDCL